VLREKYASGAFLIGVSAGAVLLGIQGLGLVPFLVGAHEEQTDWAALSALVRGHAGAFAGLGVPLGGGVFVQPDLTLEPVRRPACELRYNTCSLESEKRRLDPVATAPHWIRDTTLER
jgi:hypothetical protein